MTAIAKTTEFDTWYHNLREKEQIQIDARLLRIQTFGHFGDAKNLGDGLAEFTLEEWMENLFF